MTEASGHDVSAEECFKIKLREREMLTSRNKLFEQLGQKADQKEIDKKTRHFQDRLAAQFAKQEQRMAAIISNNSTLPVTISEVSVISAPKTRRGFLERLCQPLVSKPQDAPYTLVQAQQAIDAVALKLGKLGIYQWPISVYIDKPNHSAALSDPVDLKVYYNAKEDSWYTIKTGTEAGTAEGSIYGNAQFRNLFGGAESLNIHASKGTRTKSAYSAAFETPILSQPDFRFELSGLASSALKPWASHEEILKGAAAKLKYTTESAHQHELTYSGMWRQVTSLASTASPTVRLEAGDSFKSSIAHSWINDQRDNPLLPNRGYMLKTGAELAGLGYLRGDVAFTKLETETQVAIPIRLPGIEGKSGVALNAGFRAGLLYPLTLACRSAPSPSRLSDRFQLGGPTDVRGFKLSGLGPHDGQDAVGGDMYAAGGLSLLLPLPRTGKDSPLRLQAFVNSGRLLALKSSGKDGADLDGHSIRDSVKRTFQGLKQDLPSTAVGLGLVYAHPIARFELNMTFPLIMRRDEQARKGLQFGIGLTFL